MLGHKLKHTQHQGQARLRQVAAEADACTAPSSTRCGRTCSTTRSARSARTGTITITTSLDNGCIKVDIADDGPGIPADVRQRVFDPFFTTKAPGSGTGMGLDTARRIVEQRHGGSLAFDTGDGGTMFHVWLPLEAKGKK